MSSNKKLLEELAAARERAKTDAAARTPKLPPKNADSIAESKAPVEAVSTQKKSRVRSPRKPDQKLGSAIRAAVALKGEGTLERTTITLKLQDRSILGKAQAFFIEKGIKAPPSSTLIRIALMNLSETLDAKPERVERIFEQIRREDGRRNTTPKHNV